MICSAYVNKNMAKIELESEYGDVKLLEDMGLTFNIGDGINNQRIYVRNGQLTRSRVTTYGYEDIYCSYKGEEYSIPEKSTSNISFSTDREDKITADITVDLYKEEKSLGSENVRIATGMKLLAGEESYIKFTGSRECCINGDLYIYLAPTREYTGKSAIYRVSTTEDANEVSCDKFLEFDYDTNIYGMEDVDGKLLILQKEGGKLVAKLLDSKGKEIDNLTIKDTDKLDFKETVSCTNIINGLVRVCIFDKNNSYMVCTKIQDGFKDIYQFSDSSPYTYRGCMMDIVEIDNKLLVYNADITDAVYYSDTYKVGIYELQEGEQVQLYNGIFTLVNGDIYDKHTFDYSEYAQYQQINILEEDNYDKYR